MKAPDSTQLTTGATRHESGMWVGWVQTPWKLMQLPPRATRDRALADARAHKNRILTPPLPKKIWRRGT